jgi:hypothetical protein
MMVERKSATNAALIAVVAALVTAGVFSSVSNRCLLWSLALIL